MEGGWARRFDLEVPIEADDASNIEAYMQTSQNAGPYNPSMEHENAIFELLLDGSPHWAPISGDKDPKRILHLGCSDGAWVTKMAANYPGAEVTGVEVPEVGPKEKSALRNCHFVDHHLEEREAWGTDTSDFIYSRYAYVRVKDWDGFLTNVYAHLAPGGWFELVESDPNSIGSDDGTLTSCSVIQRIYNTLDAKLATGGRDPNSDIGPKLVGKLEKIGFTNVQTKASKAPHSPWAKDPKYKKLGSHTVARVSIPTWAQQMQYVLGLSPDEAKEMATGAVEELVSCKVHAYNILRWVIAQKPVQA